MKARVIRSDFLTTAVAVAGAPPDGALAEFAFAGRSNVGKSSLINALCGRKKLVRVSNTPGRTRALNFFELEVELAAGARAALRLCDLPGYGFAKVAKSERSAWQRLIGDYLAERASLRAVIVIVDAWVGPTPDDEQVVPWLLGLGREVIVAATKLDQLPKHKRAPRLAEIEAQLRVPEGVVLGLSSTERINIDILLERMVSLAAGRGAGLGRGPVRSR